MKKNTGVILLLLLLAVLSLTGCSGTAGQVESSSPDVESQGEAVEESETQAQEEAEPVEAAEVESVEEEADEALPQQSGDDEGKSTEGAQSNEETGAERTIIDRTGNEVVISAIEAIEKVVIISPPVISTFASAVKDTNMLVGMHPSGIMTANPDVLDVLIPNWRDIDTTFLTGFASNTEELLKLDPDIILIYGDFQKEGLENVDIPIVNFFTTTKVNEEASVGYDSLVREIFLGTDDDSLQGEWDVANEKVAGILQQVEGEEKQKGLMIMSNTGDVLTIRGIGSYGDDWLNTSGLVNAADIEGDSIEVTMEQIYVWNPDIVFAFNGLPASAYLNGNIKGQDWSQVKAFQDGRIYDTPHGVMNWGAPNVDSPLMLQWMVSKNFPDLFPAEEFESIMKDYYSRRHGIELSEETLFSILNPNAAE